MPKSNRFFAKCQFLIGFLGVLTVFAGCSTVSQSIIEIDREQLNHPAMALWDSDPSSFRNPLTGLGGSSGSSATGCSVCAH